MREEELKAMRSQLEVYADRIQEIDGADDHEEIYNQLWSLLDDAGAAINEILGETA